jgi:hypothetical protein
MTNILAFKKPTDNQPIDVEVTHCDGMFTAVCDTLHLVTEADSFEALTERVWKLAPDMIEANELGIDPDSMCLNFKFVQSAHDHRRAM